MLATTTLNVSPLALRAFGGVGVLLICGWGITFAGQSTARLLALFHTGASATALAAALPIPPPKVPN